MIEHLREKLNKLAQLRKFTFQNCGKPDMVGCDCKYFKNTENDFDDIKFSKKKKKKGGNNNNKSKVTKDYNQ